MNTGEDAILHKNIWTYPLRTAQSVLRWGYPQINHPTDERYATAERDAAISEPLLYPIEIVHLTAFSEKFEPDAFDATAILHPFKADLTAC